MSSVGSSDSSQRNSEAEVVRRNREDYRQKESDLIKKQAKEIRRLNEQHYAEIERLKTDHQDQIASLHGGARKEISARDHKYQKDIEDLRALHRKDMQRTADENQRKEEALRTSNTSDVEQRQRYNNERFEKLAEDHNAQMQKLAQSYEEAVQNSRQEQAEAILKSRGELLKKHQQEMDALRTDRERSVADLTRQYAGYRQFVNEERKDGQVRELQKDARQSDQLMHAVNKERQARQDSESIMRDGFETALQDTRERFMAKGEKESELRRQAEDDLKNTAINRIDNQVRRLELDKRDLAEANVRGQLKAQYEKQKEIKNIRDAFMANVENFKEQKDEAVRSANERNAKDIADVREELSDQMIESGRFYRGRMSEQNRIFRQAYDAMKGDFEARNEQSKVTTEDRVKHIVDETNDQKARIMDLAREQHVSSQRIKQDEIRSLRETMENDKLQVVNRLQDQMRKQEVQHAERMNVIVGKYEKQVQTLKDQLLRERKLNDENTKRLNEEMARLHKLELDQIEAKNREKVRQLGTQHSEEVRALNKRHDERLDQVIGELKKT